MKLIATHLRYDDCYVHASVAQVTETQCALTGTVYQRNWGSIPRSACRFHVQIPGAHAKRVRRCPLKLVTVG